MSNVILQSLGQHFQHWWTRNTSIIV